MKPDALSNDLQPAAHARDTHRLSEEYWIESTQRSKINTSSHELEALFKDYSLRIITQRSCLDCVLSSAVMASGDVVIERTILHRTPRIDDVLSPLFIDPSPSPSNGLPRPTRRSFDSPGLDSPSPVSCVCGKPEPDHFMIQCDACLGWYHGVCMSVKDHQVDHIDRFHCPPCRPHHGPITLRGRPRFWEEKKATAPPAASTNAKTRNGSRRFLRRLKARTFSDPAGIPVAVVHGGDVTIEYFAHNGFSTPILVDTKEGLDITVPDESITAEEIEELVGSMRELDVIEVAEQRERKMLMREWVEYFGYRRNNGKRNMTLNLISLEFSSTRMANLVSPPAVVRAISWVDNYWPPPRDPSTPSTEAIFLRPEVQKYCLMSVADSYTDFHVDFGGSSVWYHIVRGEKVFYLIRPTKTNVEKFEAWYGSPTQSETFFADLVDDDCYRCVLRAGQTVFLPSGWIHAVLTPVDSLVFGGNFLHSHDVATPLRVYALERRSGATLDKYFFPNFETLHWYVADAVVREYRGRNTTPPRYLVQGLRAMHIALNAWLAAPETVGAVQTVPDSIRGRRLVLEMDRMISAWEGELGVEGAGDDAWGEGARRKGQKRKRLRKANHFIR